MPEGVRPDIFRKFASFENNMHKPLGIYSSSSAETRETLSAHSDDNNA
jgi:hypothetical protein